MLISQPIMDCKSGSTGDKFWHFWADSVLETYRGSHTNYQVDQKEYRPLHVRYKAHTERDEEALGSPESLQEFFFCEICSKLLTKHPIDVVCEIESFYCPQVCTE